MDEELKAFLKDYYNPKAPLDPKASEPVGKRIISITERQQIFCVQLALARHRLPMSQQQMAEKIGTSQPAIARLEAGMGNPNLKMILKICEQLKRDLSSQQRK